MEGATLPQTPPEFLADLRRQGVRIWAEADKLNYSAPPGTMTAALRAELSRRKPELLALLDRTQTPVRRVPTAAPDGPAPLTFAQERLWFLDQLEPGSPTLNTPMAYRLEGPLDREALIRSLETIAERHASLRTTFGLHDGRPVQHRAASQPASLPFDVIDLSGLVVEADRLARVAGLVDEHAAYRFDLANGPVWHVRLVRLAPEEHLLLCVFHHVVFDGWSQVVFISELRAGYAAFRARHSPELPALPVDYAGYALWQRAPFQDDRLAAQLDYWRRQLAGMPTLSALPSDKPPPATRAQHGAVVSASLPAEVGVGLEALSQHEDSTRFMVLLAAFYLLLYRMTGQTDLVVGAPIAGRDRPEVERVLGVFINHLALRVDLSGDPTFRELLQRVRATALAAYDHQAVPFERLLAELQTERSLSHTPLFQCYLNMLTSDQPPLALEGLRCTRLNVSEPTSHFDVTLYVRPAGERFSLRLVYNVDLFEAEHMQTLLEQYVNLLEQVLAQPGQRLSAFSLLTPAARAWLPDPTVPLDETWHGPVYGRLAEHAQRTPTHLAVRDPLTAWTYAELEARSNQLAHALASAGVARGEVVAIYAQRSAALVWAVLGVLKAGAAFLILDPAYPEGRLADYLELAQPRGLVVLEAAGPLPAGLQAVAAGLPLRGQWALPAVPDGRFDSYARAPLAMDLGPDDLAYVSFTSGSTGRPKGVLGRHGPLSHFLPWQSAFMALTAADHFSLLSGLSHDPLQRDIFTALWVGGTLEVPAHDAQFVPGRLAAWLAASGVTVAHLTPALSQFIAETAAPGVVAEALRWVFFVGDKLTRPDVLRLRALAPKVTCLNTYGSTETQRAVGYWVVGPAALADSGQGVYPLGQGMPDVQLLVLNAAQQLCGPGEAGEIYVRSPHLAAGYLGDEALTATRFLLNPFTQQAGDRLYRTGDLGRYRVDGQLAFAGRADRQVKVRGYRIEPGEVEAVLRLHPAVRDAAVLVRELGAREAALVAYVAGEVAGPDLRDWLRRRLPDFMVPSVVVPVPALPLTPNGKLDVAALPAPLAAPGEAAGRPPRDELEQQVTALWQEVLGVPTVGVHDDFFALGGHSLLAIRLFSRIESAFGRRLPLSLLFDSPTVAHMADLLRQPAPAPADWPVLVPIQPKGERPPFFCVHDVGGSIVKFAELGRLMGAGQPFYALEAQGFDGQTAPHATITEMAAHYIEAMRQVQPRGPYYFGGYCLGAAVAYEMARQLRAQDEPIGLVAVIEGYAPTRHMPGPRWWTPGRLKLYAQNVPGWIKDHLELGAGYTWGRFRQVSVQLSKQLLKRLGLHPPLRAVDIVPTADLMPEHRLRVLEALLRASARYRAEPFDGRVTLFNTQRQSMLRDPDPQRGWQRLAKGGVDIRRIRGSHHSILEPKNVESLATALREELERVQKQERM